MVPGEAVGLHQARVEQRNDAGQALSLAQTVTALFLRLNGYLLLAKAYKTPVGAIDFRRT
jgi:predicted TIM-barrel enzyme